MEEVDLEVCEFLGGQHSKAPSFLWGKHNHQARKEAAQYSAEVPQGAGQGQQEEATGHGRSSSG